MKGHSHDPVCGIEGLFHAIAMVNINVNVQHPLVIPRIKKGLEIWGLFLSAYPQVPLSTRDVETG